MSITLAQPGADIQPWVTPHDTLEIAPQAMQLAQWFAPTEFVPADLRNRPEATLACMLTGYELGLPLMQALRGIAIIKGRPALYAEAMRTLVLSKGHEIWAQDWTSTRCLLMGRRRGEERVHQSLWTWDDAVKAKLAGSPTWQAHPRAMLLARATTQLCRLAFADVIGGLPHSVEEIRDPDWRGDDLVDAPAQLDGEVAAEAKPPRRTVRRQARRLQGTEPGGQVNSGAEVNTHVAVPEQAKTTDTGSSPQPPMPVPPAERERAQDVQATEHMTLAQQIALVCKQAGIVRARLVQAVTGKARASDVTREEALAVLTTAREIAAGHKRLVEENGLWLVVTEPDDRDLEQDPPPAEGSGAGMVPEESSGPLAGRETPAPTPPRPTDEQLADALATTQKAVLAAGGTWLLQDLCEAVVSKGWGETTGQERVRIGEVAQQILAGEMRLIEVDGMWMTATVVSSVKENSHGD